MTTRTTGSSVRRARALRRFVPALAGCLSASFAAAAFAATITWNNPAGGVWSDPANWTPNNVPDAAGEVAALPALSGAYQVTLDITPGVDGIEIAAGDPTLDLNGYSIAAVPSVLNSGTIVNFVGPYDSQKLRNFATGTIVAGGAPIQASGILWNDGRLIVGASSQVSAPARLTLDGAGTLILDHSQIYAPVDTSRLTINPGVTLSGSGVVNKRTYSYGTIECDASHGSPLRFDAVLTSYGLVRVSHQGTVHVNRPLAQNLGGTITSGTGGGVFSVMTSSQVGGALDCSQGGKLVADEGDLTLSSGTVIDGEVQRVGSTGAVSIVIATLQNVTVDAGAELSVPGHADFMASEATLTNNGIVRVAGSINFGILNGQYNIPIQGVGTVILEGGTLGTGSGAMLWNRFGQTIQGCGTINPPFLNDGTVNLDCGATLTTSGYFMNRRFMRVTGGKLVVSGTSAMLWNRGSLQAVSGTISVEKGGTLDNTGGVLAAAGRNISLGGATSAGTLIGGTLESSGGSLIQVQRAATLTDVTLGATGTLLTLPYATTTVNGVRFANRGTNRVAALGVLSVGASTDYVQTAGATVLEGGRISSARDLQIQAGALRGAGTVAANVVNAGDVAPDAGTASLRVEGSYRQTSTGSFHAALAAAGQSGRLDVSGLATLDGALTTSLADGYVPSIGDRLSVLSYGSVSGDFGQYSGMLDPASELGVVPELGQTSLALVVASTVSVHDGTASPAALRFYARRIANRSSVVLELPRAAELRARLYDASGREVARIADGPQAAGVHVFELRAGGASGALPSGMYFARATVNQGGASEVRTARVIVLN